MPAVTVYHPDGSTETIPATVGWSHRREIGHQYKLNIHVDRDLAQSVSLTRKSDEVELSGVRRGVLTDIKTGGASWTLVVRSPEWYATQQTPTLGGDRRQGDDNTLLTTLINSVPEWSVGTVADLTGPMTFVFNHAFANEAMRQIEKNAPGELRWSGDGTVDYVDALGADKSGSVTLTPSEGNLESGIRIQDRGRKFDATHLRVIGAHEGEAQRFAQLVPQADPQTYENEVRYTQPRWSDSSDTDWDRYQNKDVMAQDTIEEEAAALADELQEEFVEATATVVGEDLSVGDYVRVVKDDADLDRRMRIHRITTKTKQDTTAAVVDEVLLSTRTVAREDASSERRDIQRFNTAFQGSSVAVNGGPVIAAVDSGDPLTVPFPYPDLEFENTAEIIVQGLPYRIDSVPNEHSHDVTVTHPAHDHDVTHPSHAHDVTHPTHDHDVQIGTKTSDPNTNHGSVVASALNSFNLDGTNSNWTTFEQVDVFNGEAFVFGANVEGADSFTYVRVVDVETGETFPGNPGVLLSSGSYTLSSGDEILTDSGTTITVPEDSTAFDLQYQTDGSSAAGILWYWYQGWGEHEHDVNIGTETSDTALGVNETSTTALGTTETSTTALGTTETSTSDTAAGITEGIYETGDTPSNVDVEINGTSVATDIGTGRFEATVDVSGEFLVGQTNDITIKSDTLGRVLVTPYIRGYDQIGAE